MKVYILSVVFAVLWIEGNCATIKVLPPPPFAEECSMDAYPPNNPKNVPTYVVNLDLPPTERWQEPLKDLGPQITTLIGKLKDFILLWSNKLQFVVDFIDKDLGYLANTFPGPFKGEMQSVATATGLPLGEVVLYNIFYEVFTVCTSIIARDEAGNLYHGRNLDFGLFLGWNVTDHTWEISEALKPVIGEFQFQRGGKTVFTSVNFAGYVGVLTALKQDTFTFTMDERFNKDGGFIGILKWILGDRTGHWMGFLTRNVMENATSYAQARDMLANSPMLAPAYFILGSNQSEACVITRSREKAVDIWPMDNTNSTWYLVETNYDHWEAPFFLDDRRTPAINCLKKQSQNNFGFAGLYNVLDSKPNRNKLTTYTALMQVKGKVETYLQSCPDPCWPF